jgi:serine/threonine protein kinase
MISFRCPSCRQKLNVRDQYAGRQANCPACKQPLNVPPPSQTASPVAAGAIGTPSSLARAGIEGGVTLEHGPSALRGSQQPVRDALAQRSKPGERYVVESEIARGGMGAVLRAVDCDIHREVAVKYLLDQDDPRKKLRFVEEAQITGQLEHPNIVPIHEMGVDGQQRLFFAMKMVKGRSLAQVLDALREEPKSADKEWPLSRLLTIFINSCHALAYAHARGVIHRDLKPANIMVGDFGEVYVMDWGLAKVLASRECERPEEGAPANGIPSSAGASPPRASKVVTSREGEADLTQEGAIVGTPVYMPPEQASSDLQALDQRSDVYSLGAILYEMLTLEPPVERDGGYLAVLVRVMEGDILAPERRTPQRSGKMPRELTAIAMKAMAKQPADRYPTVEELRLDVERYLEGRSVSARPDSVREMVWKLVKRNKAASVAAVLLLGVLVASLVILASAWAETRSTYAAYRKEQGEKEARTKKAVPAFIQAARLAAQKKQLDEALEQVNVALEYDADNLDAHLLKGKLLVVKQEFLAADEQFQRYLRLQPEDLETGWLAALCRRANVDDPPTLLPILEIFVKSEDRALGRGMEDFRKKILAHHNGRIDRAWPGLGKRLKLDPAARLDLDLTNCNQVRDLAPLRGIPLARLHIGDCKYVRDLAPLRGMPLVWLSMFHCDLVADLSPLRDMRLTSLNIDGCSRIKDLGPLKGMPLTVLQASQVDVPDLSPLRGMQLTRLVLISNRFVRDLEPLRGMPLTHLDLGACDQVADLRPLKGIPLTFFSLMHCREVHDLQPLQGAPLTNLNLYGTQVHDLAPLKGIPLKWLDCMELQLDELAPLTDMELEHIAFTPRLVKKGGVGVLRRMTSLRTIKAQRPDQPPFSAEEFWRRFDAGEFKK